MSFNLIFEAASPRTMIFLPRASVIPTASKQTNCWTYRLCTLVSPVRVRSSSQQMNNHGSPQQCHSRALAHMVVRVLGETTLQRTTPTDNLFRNGHALSMAFRPQSRDALLAQRTTLEALIDQQHLMMPQYGHISLQCFLLWLLNRSIQRGAVLVISCMDLLPDTEACVVTLSWMTHLCYRLCHLLQRTPQLRSQV